MVDNIGSFRQCASCRQPIIFTVSRHYSESDIRPVSVLKSIPSVFKPEIVEVVKKAVDAKRAKEAEAKELLAGIDA